MELVLDAVPIGVRVSRVKHLVRFQLRLLRRLIVIVMVVWFVVVVVVL